MKRAPARPAATSRSAARAATPAVPTGSPTPRVWLAAVAILAVLVTLGAHANRIIDWDFWQHLAVGRAIWSQHAVPTTNLWTWPTYGAPGFTPSWLFRALLWPFWSAGGIAGLYAWRWVTVIAALAVLYLVARRLGARGLIPLVALAVSGLVFRSRSQMRPETLVAVLIAIHLWILETRRQGGPDRTPWLIANAWVWVNSHISYHLGFLLLGIHGIDALLTRARSSGGAPASRGAARLAWVALAALAISFVNPFGWRSLWEPFDYFLRQRHEPIFQGIGELQPVWTTWPLNWRNGFPLLLAGWPLLIVWRARKLGLDRVELLTCIAFTWLGVTATRFTGLYALIAAPYVARDLAEWSARRRAASRLPAPARAAAAAALVAGLGILEMAGPLGGPSMTLDRARFPVRAADFMAEHGVRGHGFNHFYIGGYQIFRFWPERERLPFMDIHQTGSTWDREYYLRAQADSVSWQVLDGRYRFDYVLLHRARLPGEVLPDLLDADPAWAPVFLDDPALLYVRRDGPLAAVAREHGYRKLGGGFRGIERLRAECGASAESCAVVVAELERAIAASPYASEARSLLANAHLLGGRFEEARGQLVAALAVNPDLPRAHERLGLIALEENRPAVARREFLEERRRSGPSARIELRLGVAAVRLGDREAARAAYRRALRLEPGHAAARDSLATLDRAGSVVP